MVLVPLLQVYLLRTERGLRGPQPATAHRHLRRQIASSVWNWSLGFPSGGQSPSVSDQTAWEQGVNIADDRYIKWLIDNYINPVMLHQYYDSNGNRATIDGPYPNEWLGMDEMAINYGAYGVLDDNGHWVGMDQGPVMDSPFPNGSMALHQMFQTFFLRLHQLDPGIHILANLGTPDTWSSFKQDFANVDGLSLEDIFAGNREDSSGGNRDKIYNRWTNLTWWAGQGKVGLWRSLLDPTASAYPTDVRSGLMGYLMIAGPNTAWAPEVGGNATEINPADYSSMKLALGPATGAMTSQRAAGTSDAGYALYTRHTRNGIAYVNETGATVTAQCPSGATCEDRAGVTVTSISIPDLTGDYMLVRAR